MSGQNRRPLQVFLKSLERFEVDQILSPSHFSKLAAF